MQQQQQNDQSIDQQNKRNNKLQVKNQLAKQESIQSSQPQLESQAQFIKKPLQILNAITKQDPLYENKDLLTKCTLDDLFALYLSELSKKVNAQYYSNCVKFVFLYRECLNLFGWQKKYESIARIRVQEIKMAKASLALQPDSTLLQQMQMDQRDLFQQEVNKLMKQQPINGNFCENNNAEHSPQVCNQFVSIFLDSKEEVGLPKEDAIDLTRNFNYWLYCNGLTCSKLTYLQMSINQNDINNNSGPKGGLGGIGQQYMPQNYGMMQGGGIGYGSGQQCMNSQQEYIMQPQSYNYGGMIGQQQEMLQQQQFPEQQQQQQFSAPSYERSDYYKHHI